MRFPNRNHIGTTARHTQIPPGRNSQIGSLSFIPWWQTVRRNCVSSLWLHLVWRLGLCGSTCSWFVIGPAKKGSGIVNHRVSAQSKRSTKATMSAAFHFNNSANLQQKPCRSHVTIWASCFGQMPTFASEFRNISRCSCTLNPWMPHRAQTHSQGIATK